ncbi:MAG: GNAT family protein [Bacteroidota bacterium]
MSDRVTLTDFEAKYFDTLISWIASERELIQFAGPIFTFPLTTPQLHSYLDDPNRKAFALLSSSSQEHLGHGEIYRKSPFQVDLSRLLIGPHSQRGKGLGTAMVNSLIVEAQKRFTPKEIRLKVYTWNTSAIRCYSKIGFIIDPNTSYETPVSEEVWHAHEMVLTLE